MATTRKASGSGLLGALKKVVSKGTEQAKALTKTSASTRPQTAASAKSAAPKKATPSAKTASAKAAPSKTPTRKAAPSPASRVQAKQAAVKVVSAKAAAKTSATPKTGKPAKVEAGSQSSVAARATRQIESVRNSAKATTQAAVKQVRATAKATRDAVTAQAKPHVDQAKSQAKKTTTAVQSALKTPLFNGHQKAREMADSARLRVGTAVQAIRPNPESRAFMATSRGKRIAKQQAKDAAAVEKSEQSES